MADKVKKTKAPAKARKSETKETKKIAVVEASKAALPSREEIAELARRYWAERGWQDGHAEQDWLRAERELQGMAS